MAASTTLPPVADIDQTQKAMQIRKRVLKELNEKLTPELRKWVVTNLASDIEKANG